MGRWNLPDARGDSGDSHLEVMETAGWISLGTLVGVFTAWYVFTDRLTQIRQLLGCLGVREVPPQSPPQLPS